MMRAFLLLPMALLNSACGAASEPSEQPRPAYERLLGPEDTDRPARIRTGQWIGIRVSDNPSIGNVWTVLDVPANLRSEGFLYGDEEERTEGSDTEKIFRFVGTSAGSGTIRLALDYRGERQREIEYQVITE